MNLFLKKHEKLAKESNLSIKEWKEKIKFNEKDLGWIIISIGMAIGGGIIFLPIQIGLMGIWVFFLSSIIGYPAMYLFQRLFINTLATAKTTNNYPEIISNYLGKNIGILLGVLYFFMLLIWLFVYSAGIINDSASYLYTFGITKSLLSNTWWYSVIIISILMSISSLAEKILFKISSFIVITKLLIILLLATSMLHFINLQNVDKIPDISLLIKKSIITLPFTLTSILFIQTLSPMVISFRKNEKNIIVAKYKAIRAMNIAFIILFIVVFFYIISFSLSIGYDKALSAYKQNISALAIAAQFLHIKWIIFVGMILNIFALLTSFFGTFLGFIEAGQGILNNILERFISFNKINSNIVKIFTILIGFSLIWIVIILNIRVLTFTSICSPIFGIIGCLIPAYLVYKVPFLNKYKNISIYIIIFTGILLLISPVLALLN